MTFPFDIIRRQVFTDMSAVWYQQENTVGFTLLPAGSENRIPEHRQLLDDTIAVRGYSSVTGFHFPAARAESCVQYKISGDALPNGFGGGVSLCNSATLDRLHFVEFREIANGVAAVFRDERRLELIQQVTQQPGRPCVTINTSITNCGTEPVELEQFNSFAIGLLSPFQSDQGPECYRFHRWLSSWSAEGRLESRSLEEWNLEPSWSAFGVRNLRFGQQGSMPVHGFFPMAAFEDCAAGVIWGVELEAFGSWELELLRRGDFCTLTGGLVDREFGQWTKTLQPGETLCGITAALSCVNGSLDDLLPRLVTFQEEAAKEQPESESEVPVVFNDWCTTWGRPFPDRLRPILDRLAGRDVGYFVLDAGWFADSGDALGLVGDWQPYDAAYEGDIGKFAAEIISRGLRPGVWFEFEVATESSRVAAEHPDWMLHLDGKLLKSGVRHFLDFRKPEVRAYLDDRLIAMLRRNHFGYLKVDYNAPTGFGCDGDGCVPAEALRQHTLAVVDYFRHLRRELPDLVVEICSSGGHRLSPGWMRLGAMGSFSDAHEAPEIPIIGANTARLIPMRSNQIWAVLHPTDDDRRLYYSLAAGMLGRLCLSGDFGRLGDGQLAIVDAALTFYRRIAPLILAGRSRVIRHMGASWTRPTGSQIFYREGDNGLLLVVHTFEHAPEKLSVELDGSCAEPLVFAPGGVRCRRNGSHLELDNLTDFTGAAFYLPRRA